MRRRPPVSRLYPSTWQCRQCPRWGWYVPGIPDFWKHWHRCHTLTEGARP